MIGFTKLIYWIYAAVFLGVIVLLVLSFAGVFSHDYMDPGM